ncbi:MAG: pyruvate dehydrogenase complex dihydrolipoamide acetyltransferase [Acidobacteriota bacterium]
MANKILMPKLSPTMEEGQISRWLKKEGDAIDANETIAEVDTDKATMEMTSLEAGTLLKIIVGAGSNAKLGQVIGIIGKKGEDFSALLASIEAAPAASTPAEKPAPTPAPAAKAVSLPPMPKPAPPPPPAAAPASTGRMVVSPIAAKMAAEKGVDLRGVRGTGPGGRIIKRDIENLNGGTSKPSYSYTPSTVYGASAFREEGTSKMRQVIAQRLAESIGPIPTFYLTVEIEMDAVLGLRKKLNEGLNDAQKVSVNDIVIKAAASALVKHPWVNASYRDSSVRFYEDADVGVAVAIEDGLITPVVRSANKKSFVEIAQEVKALASKARERKLQPEEYTGATFSISNLGMFGIKEFTAIINPPEAAIIAVGGAEQVPVVRNGEIAIRSVMNVTMSCDHRVIDGATGAKFLQTFKDMLEHPALILM